METSRIIVGFIRASPKFLFKFKSSRYTSPQKVFQRLTIFFGKSSSRSLPELFLKPCTRRFFFPRMFTPLVMVYDKQVTKLQMRGDTYVLQGVSFGEQEVLRVLQDCG